MMRYAKEGVGEAIVDIVGSINAIDVARAAPPPCWPTTATSPPP